MHNICKFLCKKSWNYTKRIFHERQKNTKIFCGKKVLVCLSYWLVIYIRAGRLLFSSTLHLSRKICCQISCPFSSNGSLILDPNWDFRQLILEKLSFLKLSYKKNVRLLDFLKCKKSFIQRPQNGFARKHEVFCPFCG